MARWGANVGTHLIDGHVIQPGGDEMVVYGANVGTHLIDGHL